MMDKIEHPHEDDDKETDDLLISEQGIDKEKQSSIRSLRIDNKLQNLGQSSISALKSDYIRYINYFVGTKDYKPEEHALYQGVQTYGYDQILFFRNQKLYRTKFKGSEPISQHESVGWPNSDKVTMMTVLNELLLIGYLDGSVQIFNLLTQKMELDIQGDGHNGPVRDVHYYDSAEDQQDSIKFLAVLYVQNKGKERTYNMKQYLFKDQNDLRSSSVRHLFNNNEDHVDSSKSEQRREFYWWEQFRCLGDGQFAFLFDTERKIGIVDCKERCKEGHFGQQQEFHGVLETKMGTTPQDQEKELGRALFWMFKMPERTFKNLKPKTKKIGLPDQEKIECPSILKSEYIVVNKHGIFWKFEGESRLERIVDTQLDQDKVSWKPTDCTLLMNSTKDGQKPFSILIAGMTGLYEYQFKQQEVVPPAKPPLSMKPVFRKINSESMYRIKQCGRILIATGIIDYLFLYESSTLEPICKVPSLNSRFFKINEDQIFLKSKTLQRWCVIGLQESGIVSTLQERIQVDFGKDKVKKILYDKIQGDKNKYVVGIVSDTVSYHPNFILARYKGFNGEVKAVDLNENKGFQDFVLMTREESKKGFITLCTVLHKNLLTWLTVEKKLPGKPGEGIVYVRQKELTSKKTGYSQVEVKGLGEYFVFGGFFLSVFRDSIYNQKSNGYRNSKMGNAVLILADSRPADLRAFDSKRYIEIDFEKSSFNEFQPAVDMIGNEDKSVFPLNDVTLFKVTEQDGSKSIYMKNANGKELRCLTKAKELRLSPDGRSVVMYKNSKYFVSSIKVTDHGAEICNEYEIKTEYMTTGTNNNLRDLSTVYWLGNKYFAIGEFISKTVLPQTYMIFKAKDGTSFCQFLLKNEFEFLKNTTAPNVHVTSITGILDKLTNKIYDVSIFTLIHLGARRFNHSPNGPIIKHEMKHLSSDPNQESQLKIADENRIIVLGIHAPALFFTALRNLREQMELENKRKLILDKIFRYTMVQRNEAEGVDFQNMFHYLCKNNEPELLKSWLVPASNYFTDGAETSPMKLTSVICAKPLRKWLSEQIQGDQLQSVYSGLSRQEITSILNQPLKLVNEVCDDLKFNCSHAFNFKSAEIVSNFSTIENITDLKAPLEHERVEKELFKYTQKHKDQQHEITPGDPFEVYMSLCKFDIKPGTVGSKQLLNGIQAAGEQEPDIYLNKIVKSLLDFKFQQVSWFRHVIFSLQILFLLLLQILPSYEISEGEVVIIWSCLFILREISQFTSLVRAGDFSLSDYFGSFWNWLDLTNIAAQLWYFHYFLQDGCAQQQAEAYSFMVLVTWLNTLQYLRLYEYFRMLIDLCLKVFQDPQTWKFMVVMGIMLLAFSASHYQYYIKLGEPRTFGIFFQMIVYTAFGDFGEGEEYGDHPEQMFFFAFSIFVLCLIMLNLLIGILSDVMAKIWETQEQSDAAALCDIIGDLENLMFWVSQKEENNVQRHLIFVEEPEHKISEGDERTQEIVNELDKKLTNEITVMKKEISDQFKDQLKKFKNLLNKKQGKNKQD